MFDLFNSLLHTAKNNINWGYEYAKYFFFQFAALLKHWLNFNG